MKNIGKGKAVLLTQRYVNAFLGRRCLQLEIERSTETLAQRQSPGFINPASERRVDDQLHSAGFIKKPFGNDAFLSRYGAQHRSARREVIHQLRGPRVFQRRTPP